MKKYMKVLLPVLILSILVVGWAPLARLTVINKSGSALHISLEGKEYGNFHYLPIPYGERGDETYTTWTVVPDKYTTKIYHEDELCWSTINDEAEKLYVDYLIKGNTKLVVTECFMKPPNFGDPDRGMYKWYLEVSSPYIY